MFVNPEKAAFGTRLKWRSSTRPQLHREFASTPPTNMKDIMRTRTALQNTAPTASAQSIARTLYNQGLEDEDLFAAMWMWHDNTGIEPRDVYYEYKTIAGSRL